MLTVATLAFSLIKQVNCLGNRNLTEGGAELERFGYHFNEDGKLVNKDGNGFVFEDKPGDRGHNQRRYESIGAAVDVYVYEYLENVLGLKKFYIPVDAKPKEGKGFFFASPESARFGNKILVLIHGSGVVRAGQWARRLIINNDLDSGTQIPFIRKAQGLGYLIVVLNTNQVTGPNEAGAMKRIRDCDSPEKHAKYIWKHFIQKWARELNAKIAIVAHSYGGVVFCNLATEFPDDFADKVFAVALTDSVHSCAGLQKWRIENIKRIAQNWVTSNEPLDTPVSRRSDIIPCVSAGNKLTRLKFCSSSGTTVHEWTSAKSFESIFKFMEKKFAEKSLTESIEPRPNSGSRKRKSEDLTDQEL